MSQFGSYGKGNGQFIAPRFVAFNANGNILVSDTNNNNIQVFGLVPLVNSKLYPFTSHKFTNAGAIGANGPTLAQIKNAYSSAEWTQYSDFLNMTKQGIQEWTVPFTGNYTILAAGAMGKSTSDIGSKAAILQVTTFLTLGEKIKILVGQAGEFNGYGGGGGGGTFVVRGSQTPIIVAGGSGGCDYNDSGSQNATLSASINTSGQNGGPGSSANPGQGGKDGNGGKLGNGDGAGGGLLTDGQSRTYAGVSLKNGGSSFVNGGTGGAGSIDNGFG
ncbi:MAG: hypothetical protein EBS90_11980, partial [Betaproteobacteria bacterium]|nr:hypothetical protein [Betaproteobacteria bacterium]